MKRFKLFFIIVFLGLPVYGQVMPDFKPLRYDEDYSFLKEDTSQSNNWYATMKYRPLSRGGSTYLSLGGEVRYQYLYFKNEDWGEAPPDNNGFILTRYLAHADLHIVPAIRVFTQVQSSFAAGKESFVSAVDQNQLDLHQAFVQVNTVYNPNRQLILRVGRQELSYGSQRLLSVRELPNNRQAFDALKGIFKTNKFSLYAFYNYYVTAQSDILDDVIMQDTKLRYAYLVQNKIPLLKNLDVYYLALHKKEADFQDGPGREWRHSLGSRIWGNNHHWRYDLEGVYQFGKFANQAISAWTLSLNSGYSFDQVKFKPEFGFKTEIISGDGTPKDDKLQTFNPLFPRGAYFGLAALIGPVNLIDMHPSFSLELVPDKLNWTTDYDIFWRYSQQDGVYAPNVSVIYSGQGIRSKFIGHQVATDFTYTPHQYLLLRTEATWFKTGTFLKMAGPGKNIFYTSVTAQFKF